MLAVALFVAPAAAQLDSDYLPPQLNYERNFGYQTPINPPMATSAPLTQSYQAVGPNLPGGGAYGSGGAGYGPARQFTIYKPGAVSRVPYLAEQAQAQQSTEWPPRGGPWGLGSVPSAAAAGQATNPLAAVPGMPPLFGGSESADEADEADAPTEFSTSGLSPYRPGSQASLALYDQYRNKVEHLGTTRDKVDVDAERVATGPTSLGSIYGERLRTAATPIAPAENTDERDAKPGTEKPESPYSQPSLLKYLSPIYYQPTGVGDSQ
jgi:hypothetical protein